MSYRYSLTREQAREIDRLAMEKYGVRGIILMENAGRECIRIADDMLGDCDNPTVEVFCGTGNNGGDGFVMARHLWNRGYAVRTWLVGDVQEIREKESDASINLDIVQRMGIPVEEITSEKDVEGAVGEAAEADLMVDALLGTGITGNVRGLYAPLIQSMNETGVPILAVDMPSGLDCDTGEVRGVAIRARRTVTFVMKKRGQTKLGAENFTGRIHVAEISVPRQLIEEKIEQWEKEGQ